MTPRSIQIIHMGSIISCAAKKRKGAYFINP